MAKRILWLFNHSSLRKFEVPMLIDMGYEVFCPKQWNIFDFSASITYEYDASLTIPKEVLDKLNKIDFYKTIPYDVMELLNKYFDITICMFEKEMLTSLVKGFKGAICLHVFGLFDPMNYTSFLGYNLLSIIDSCKNRFWFLPSYKNLSEIEAPLLQKRSLFMPIGLNGNYIGDNWCGGNKKILFIAPRIKNSAYFTQVYKNFCFYFGDLPHVIGGAQPIAVPEDETVTGFLSNEEYEYNMRHLACMYYHSTEPRHLHYHPLEAIKRGMPLIFMAGGMLDYLGGENLPGRAQSIKEARKKLQKLLNGDKTFVTEVTTSQKVLLEPFETSYCQTLWEKGLKKIETSIPKRDENKTFIIPSKQKRIAIVLPAPYTGGVLDYTIRFILNIHNSIEKYNDNIKLIFAYPENEIYKAKGYFKNFKDAGIEIRKFVWKSKSIEWANSAIRLAGFEPLNGINLSHMEYSVLHDGAANFMDCDHIIFTADVGSLPYPFFCLRPFSVVVHDYIQRYVPEAISKKTNNIKITNQKNADTIIVTSKPTFNDAIQFAGLNKDKVMLTPLMLEMMKENKNSDTEKIKQNFFLWSTNAAPHKNHLRALKAIELYYYKGGNFECYISGANTQYLKPGIDIKNAPVFEDYVNRIHNIINNSEILKNHLHFMGDLEKKKFIDILKKAKFIFHPGYGDNGNGTVVDAAGFGIPSISSDYPAMRYLSKFMGLPLKYMSPFNIEEMADALLDIESHHNELAKALPSRSVLEKNEYYNKSDELYACIKEIVGF